MKKSIKRMLTTFACFAIVLIAGVTLAACGGSPKTLWEADLANDDVFGIYGEVTKNDDGTVTLGVDENHETAGSTYFGEADKNYDWVDGGMTVKLGVYVDSDVITAGERVVWSLGLNEKYVTEADESQGIEASESIEYLTELAVFFVGTDDGVKFVFKETGVDQDDYLALVSGDDAATLTTGYYTVNYDFNVDSEGYVTLVVSLQDEDGKDVYESTESRFNVIDSTQYEGEVKEEMVVGLRYLWCVRASTPVTVSSLAITE